MDADHEAFIEETALMYEGAGLPRIAGRIIAYLLICQPSAVTAQQLTEDLRASKASISNMTRLLMQYGLIQKTSTLGERHTLYQIKDGAWTLLMEQKLAGLTQFIQVADRGLALMQDAPEEHQKRLLEMKKLYLFFEQELPELIARLRKTMRGDL